MPSERDGVCMGPGRQTYTDKEPTRSEMGRMTEDLDQGMTTTSVPPLRGKFSTWRSQRTINLPVQ